MRYYIGTPGPDGATAETLVDLGVAVVPGDVPPVLAELMGDSVIAELPDDAAADALEEDIGGLVIPVEPWERLTKALGYEPTLEVNGPMFYVAGPDGYGLGNGAVPREAIEEALDMLEIRSQHSRSK